MAVSGNNIARIGEVKSLFESNVTNRIMSNTYHAGNVPRFGGKAEIGGGTKTYFENPVAIPPADLENYNTKKNQINGIGYPGAGSVISASGLYNALVSTMSRMGAVRNFSSTWYHQSGNEMKKMSAVSGKAVFKDNLPGISGPAKNRASRQVATGTQEVWTRNFNEMDASGSSFIRYDPNKGILIRKTTYRTEYYWDYFPTTKTNNYNTTGTGQKADGWERNTNTGSQNCSKPGNPMGRNNKITAGNVTTLINNIYNNWANVCKNTINYTYYSCHTNCHGNCHWNRGRR